MFLMCLLSFWSCSLCTYLRCRLPDLLFLASTDLRLQATAYPMVDSDIRNFSLRDEPCFRREHHKHTIASLTLHYIDLGRFQRPCISPQLRAIPNRMNQ